MRLRDLLRTPDPMVTRDRDLRTWRSQFSDATPIADLVPRHRNTVVGVISRLLLDPAGPLETTVEDGTGRLTCMFHGRRSLPSLELGRALRLTGVVAIDTAGRRVMRDPVWEPVAEPYLRDRPAPEHAPQRAARRTTRPG